MRRVGPDANPVLVADDFLHDPDFFRQLGERLNYNAPTNLYPGLIAGVSLNFHALATAIVKRIMSEAYGIEGEPVFLEQEDYPHKPRFSLVTLTREFIRQNTPREEVPFHPMRSQYCPHTDSGFVTVVIHLGPPGADTGGTHFWQHRASGVQSFPRMDHLTMQKYQEATGINFFEGISRASELFDTMIDSVSLNNRLCQDVVIDEHAQPFPTQDIERWEHLGCVESCFNRLVAFPGWQFHSVDPGTVVPTSVSTARMSMVMGIGITAMVDSETR